MEPEQSERESEALDKVVLTQVMRMNATINGIVVGFVAGGAILIATLWLVIKGGDVVGPHLSLLDEFFIGYSVTYGGSLIGFVYGFLVGYAIGYFIAFTYNQLVELRESWRARRAKRAQKSVVPVRDDNSHPAQAPSASPRENAVTNGKDPAQAIHPPPA